ncbi:MAG: hypothetical protein ACOYT4_05005 [Nanoarchaeota archaeon]
MKIDIRTYERYRINAYNQFYAQNEFLYKSNPVEFFRKQMLYVDNQTRHLKEDNVKLEKITGIDSSAQIYAA